MSAAEFALGVARFAAIALPLLLAARFWRRAYLDLSGPLALLVDAVLVLSALVIGGELLGLVSAMNALPLAGLFWCLAPAGWGLARRVTPARSLRRRTAAPAAGQGASPAAGNSSGRWPVLVGLAVVIAQWCEGTANVLGGGMLSFDSVWYHMPFAGRFAQTGSVTASASAGGCNATLSWPVGERLRAFALLGGGAAQSGGWWYLRNALYVGNPVGQRLQISPLVLPWPRSARAPRPGWSTSCCPPAPAGSQPRSWSRRSGPRNPPATRRSCSARPRCSSCPPRRAGSPQPTPSDARPPSWWR